jgi:hypothetical protein
MTTLLHPPHFPDMPPADFYLFPQPKLTINRRRFCDATDIIKNATAELKRFATVSL